MASGRCLYSAQILWLRGRNGRGNIHAPWASVTLGPVHSLIDGDSAVNMWDGLPKSVRTEGTAAPTGVDGAYLLVLLG
jgi:hypothetical protein